MKQDSPSNYLQHIKSIFEEKGDYETAQGQMKYMRHKFEYYGLKAQVWMGLLNDIFKEKGIYQGEQLKTFVRICMNDEYREINYAGLTMLEKQMKKSVIALSTWPLIGNEPHYKCRIDRGPQIQRNFKPERLAAAGQRWILTDM